MCPRSTSKDVSYSVFRGNLRVDQPDSMEQEVQKCKGGVGVSSFKGKKDNNTKFTPSFKIYSWTFL